jgi:hypothetical protein
MLTGVPVHHGGRDILPAALLSGRWQRRRGPSVVHLDRCFSRQIALKLRVDRGSCHRAVGEQPRVFWLAQDLAHQPVDHSTQTAQALAPVRLGNRTQGADLAHVPSLRLVHGQARHKTCR